MASLRSPLTLTNDSRPAPVRNRRLTVALFVSALFHLSMVTLFSIYIWVPVNPIHYYEFDIVDPVTRQSVIHGQRLRLPSLEEALASPPNVNPLLAPDSSLTISGPEDLATVLPDISLPTLEIAELERLHMRERGMRALAEFEPGRPRDSWGRFISEIGRLDDALRQLPLFSGPDDEAGRAPVPVSRPVEGLAVYVDWMGEPEDRELIFSPPIDALWGVAPSRMTESISVVFKVNPQGEVIEVLTPVEDEQGIVASAGRALLKYRFAPLEGSTQGDQYGTLIIAPERDL
ncbi:MAG: hypothetical protein AMXMBFR4_31340 [Candidatus Hydrogenedentota bacterium]